MISIDFRKDTKQALRKAYTQKITDNPDWELAGIFADEGITGTSAEKRPKFMEMIKACENG